jgi:hypothetical protein
MKKSAAWRSIFPLVRRLAGRDRVLDASSGQRRGSLPELGYELRTSGHHDSHVASIGCGIGYGVLAPIIGTYTPRVLVGWADGQTAVGFRHGIAFHALMTAVSLEVSHQVLRVGESFSHEIQLTAGLNLGPLLLAALW